MNTLVTATSGSYNPADTYFVTPISTAIVETYDIYVFAENYLGTYAFSGMIQVKIVCTPTSTVIQEIVLDLGFESPLDHNSYNNFT